MDNSDVTVTLIVVVYKARKTTVAQARQACQNRQKESDCKLEARTLRNAVFLLVGMQTHVAATPSMLAAHALLFQT